MKSILKLSAIIIIAFTVVFTSCKKYPDGPTISLKTKMARITRVWQDPNNASSTMEFKKDGTVYSDGVLASGVTWKFSSDKKNIEETMGSLTISAQIMRLTSKDLWLQGNGSSTIDKYTAK
ncbi:MAG TPA: hypothetical protein VII99_08005 [Bacteroidia bacterium]